MGAPLLSIRRKPSAKASGGPTPSSSASAPALPPRSTGPVFSVPKHFGPRFSSKSARSGSDGSGDGTADASSSSCAHDTSRRGDQSSIGIVKFLGQKMNGSSQGSPKQKRSVRLSIAPDEESESMQVNLLEGSPSPVKSRKKILGRGEGVGSGSPVREDDCIYTVGSVEYRVKHSNGDNSSKENDKPTEDIVGEKDDSMNPRDDKSIAECIRDGHDGAITTHGLGSSEKKKSGKKMGISFKRSGKKDNSGDNEEGGSSNNNNDGGGDQNGDKKDGAGDDNNDENQGPGKSVIGPVETNFSPERVQFAADSTLPVHAGSESSAPTDHPSWTPVDGTEFKVRKGPNYPKNGLKEASLESLYEVYCVRFFRSGKRTVGGATRIMPLPEMELGGVKVNEGDNKGGEENGDNKGGEENTETKTEIVNGEAKTEEAAGGDDQGDTNADGAAADVPSGGKHYPELNGTKIPDVLVVHFMLPYEPPNMFKQKDDGPGGECVYYLKPSRRFLDEISGRVPATPATTLFAKWCEECESSFKMRSRFKCMALVRDIDKHNFGLLKNYNGKPVLITESGRACSGYHGDVRYLEMTANVHYWAFMAKKGFVSIIPKFAGMQMEVGFTIEAHTDSEMPECMLGSTVLSYISDSTGPMITPEMQEPVHEHQS